MIIKNTAIVSGQELGQGLLIKLDNLVHNDFTLKIQ